MISAQKKLKCFTEAAAIFKLWLSASQRHHEISSALVKDLNLIFGIFTKNDFGPPTPLQKCVKLQAKLKPLYSSALRVAVRFAALRFSIVTPLYCFRRKQ